MALFGKKKRQKENGIAPAPVVQAVADKSAGMSHDLSHVLKHVRYRKGFDAEGMNVMCLM